jgi:hypothetical protein
MKILISIIMLGVLAGCGGVDVEYHTVEPEVLFQLGGQMSYGYYELSERLIGGDKCDVYLADVTLYGEEACYLENLRHEEDHCEGWKHTHGHVDERVQEACRPVASRWIMRFQAWQQGGQR